MDYHENDALEDDLYSGEIKTNSDSMPLKFRVSAGKDHRLRFELNPVSDRIYLSLNSGSDSIGKNANTFSLAGRSFNGKHFVSHRMILIGSEAGSDGYRIFVESLGATVTLTSPKPIDKPVLRLRLRSFASFRNPVIETQMGTLEVHGASNTTCPDEVSGSLTIEAPLPEPGADWFKRADDLLRHMHRGLMLAHGGRLQTPCLEYFNGSTCKKTFFAGSGFPAEFPVQHQIHHGPFLRALVDRYQSRGPLPDALWTALGWTQNGTTFNEIRFLTAMTGIETIIGSLSKEEENTIIEKELFKNIKDELKNNIENSDTISDEQKCILKEKIHEINRKSLRTKIQDLLSKKALFDEKIDEKSISSITKLRNAIIHGGQSPDNIDLLRNTIAAKEIITRIILKEIGFLGYYRCYVGGAHDRRLPAE